MRRCYFFLPLVFIQLAATSADLQNIVNEATASIRDYQFDKAIQLYQESMQRAPHQPQILYNLAYAFNYSGKQQEAIPLYEKVLKISPEHDFARLGLAKAYLATGDFSRGWHHFEWRMANQKNYRKEFRFHDLVPTDLKGKTVLLRPEWGLGDTMQFIRYAQRLKQNGVKKIIVQTFDALLPLFSLCPYIDIVFSKHDPAPCPYDIQIPLLSLPLFFGTTQETIPASIPYLWADNHLIKLWNKKLEPYKNTLRVGLCWQAKPIYIEKNPLTKRSIALKVFAPLADVEGVTFFSLQRIFGTEQLEDLPEGFVVHDFGPNFDKTNGRFMDTAAVIQNVDLVISVDTAIVHLAGALGAPVWVLLPSVAEWRWMLEGETTPWYPNVRLFRKPNNGTWSDVIETIKHALHTFAAEQKKGTNT